MRQVIWSDSTTVLAWIKNVTKIVFCIGNRIKTIRELLNVDFKFVPGHTNTADIASHGTSFLSLQESMLWTGPSWLRSEDWPAETFEVDALQPRSATMCRGKQ